MPQGLKEAAAHSASSSKLGPQSRLLCSVLTRLGTVEGQGSAASDLEFGARIRKVGAAVSPSYEGRREAADTHMG